MSKMLKKVVFVLFAVFVIFAVTAGPVINRGYRMYRDAVGEISIDDKINEIKESNGYTDIDDIPQFFVDKLIESEDTRFYSHKGVDLISIFRAVLINLKDKNYTQGGSTLTQQLSKNMYFSFEKDMSRKIAEVFVAKQIEKNYTKDEIISLYCSVVYFGEDCYGLREACRYYYNVRPENMTELQAEQLVKTLKAPSVNNPSTMNQ